MNEARGEITGKKPATGCVDPITVTVKEASALTGLGLTTMWRLIKEQRLQTRHVPGVARTLVDFGSLRALIEPAETAAARTSAATLHAAAAKNHPSPQKKAPAAAGAERETHVDVVNTQARPRAQ